MQIRLIRICTTNTSDSVRYRVGRLMLSVMYLGNVRNVFMRARIGDGLHIWILTPVVLIWLGINNNKSI